MATGTAVLDFGAFPGSSHASIAVAEATIGATSHIEAWLEPGAAATADHSADEHMVETLRVMARDPVNGVGFTIHGWNVNPVTEQEPPQYGSEGQAVPSYSKGTGTRIWGRWNVGWAST